MATKRSDLRRILSLTWPDRRTLRQPSFIIKRQVSSSSGHLFSTSRLAIRSSLVETITISQAPTTMLLDQGNSSLLTRRSSTMAVSLPLQILSHSSNSSTTSSQTCRKGVKENSVKVIRTSTTTNKQVMLQIISVVGGATTTVGLRTSPGDTTMISHHPGTSQVQERWHKR